MASRSPHNLDSVKAAQSDDRDVAGGTGLGQRSATSAPRCRSRCRRSSCPRRPRTAVRPTPKHTWPTVAACWSPRSPAAPAMMPSWSRSHCTARSGHRDRALQGVDGLGVTEPPGWGSPGAAPRAARSLQRRSGRPAPPGIQDLGGAGEGVQPPPVGGGRGRPARPGCAAREASDRSRTTSTSRARR